MDKLWFPGHDEANHQLLMRRSNHLLARFLERSEDVNFKQQVLQNTQGYKYEGAINNSGLLDTSIENFFMDQLGKMLLKDIPVEAFLCTIAPKNSRLDEWQGLILAVALEHFRLFSDQGRAVNV